MLPIIHCSNIFFTSTKHLRTQTSDRKPFIVIVSMCFPAENFNIEQWFKFKLPVIEALVVVGGRCSFISRAIYLFYSSEPMCSCSSLYFFRVSREHWSQKSGERREGDVYYRTLKYGLLLEYSVMNNFVLPIKFKSKPMRFRLPFVPLSGRKNHIVPLFNNNKWI